MATIRPRRLPIEHGLAAWLEEVAQAADQSRVVVLASGDPGFFGVAARLRGRLGKSGVRVIPGISALQAAAARLGLDWQGMEVVSLHGRDVSHLFSALVRAPRVAVYTDPHNSPQAIASALLARGQEAWRMHVAQDMGGPGEKLGSFTLQEAQSGDFADLNMVILERAQPLPPLPLGLPEEALEHQEGLITKLEVRAVALALLRLEPWHLMWDLGAGSGSMGLVASRMLWQGSVIAVERHEERAAQIAANRKAFSAANLDLVQGEMPGSLAGLPDPDRVFIGGGGPALGAICQEVANRLRPGGVAVCAAVRMDALQEARQVWQQAGLTVQATMVQASRSRDLAGSIFFKAINPVWLVNAAKETI